MAIDRAARIAAALEEAERLHGEVSRRTGGVDPDWPLFYAWYLAEWSDLPDALGVSVTKSRLVFELIALDREYRSEPHDEAWSGFYARRLLALDWSLT